MPGATEVVLAIHDHEVLDTHALELDGRADPTEAGADDQGFEVLGTHGTTIYAVPAVPVNTRPRIIRTWFRRGPPVGRRCRPASRECVRYQPSSPRRRLVLLCAVAGLCRRRCNDEFHRRCARG